MEMRQESEKRDGRELSLREKIQITDANLARLDAESAALAEKREALLCEKLRAILTAASEYRADEYPASLFRSMIRDEHFPDEFRSMTERTPVLPEDTVSVSLVQQTLSAANAAEQVILCRQLAHARDDAYRITDGIRDKNWRRMVGDLIRDENHGGDDPAHELDVKTPRHAGERVAYLKNVYTDLANERFLSLFPHGAPAYYSDFPGVCEAVYYGQAGACILPMENSADGKLERFYALLTKYDLRIVGTCRITAEDTDTTTKYALLRKSVSVPETEDPMYLECRVILEDGMTLEGLLSAAGMYGLTPARVDSVPDSYTVGGDAYDVIFRAGGDGDICAMLTYLYLLAPQFTLFGIYPQI